LLYPERVRDFGSLDYRPLAAPVDPVQLRRFRRRLASIPLSEPVPPPNPGDDPDGPRFGAGGVLTLVVFAVGWVVLGLVMGSAFASGFGGDAGPGPWQSLGGFALGCLVSALVTALLAALTVVRARLIALRRFRLDAFARANGMVTAFEVSDPGFPGAIFRHGRDRMAYDCLRTHDRPVVELGSYRCTTGDDKHRQVHRWGYLAIRLSEPLPHMVLDARANNGLFGATNLPTEFARNQILHLEGDFDRYFTLYCPAEYERDALYVFTPDLMALLIDEASAFDVEVIDDRLFVYSADPIDTADPDALARMFRIVATVGAKTESRAERYRDERSAPASAEPAAGGFAPPRAIARPGRRLRRPGLNIGAVVVIVASFGVWAWFMLGR
jgi:hypothetical protein